VTSVGLTGGNGITVTGTSPITSSGSWTLGVNASDLKSHLSLSNVENVAVSTWAGSANLTTLGTVTTGIWQGTNIDWTRVSKTGSSLADLATRSAGDLNSGTLDAARLPAPTTTTLGGVKRNTGTSGQFVNGIDAGGALTYGTPAGGGSASVDARIYTADDTWTNPSPSTPKRVYVRLIGGGGGGGSGRKGVPDTVRTAGAGGGAGAVVEFWTLTTELSGSETVTVGAGGTGAAAVTANNTNGSAGSNGGNTIFAGVTATRGAGGGGGSTSQALGGAATASGSSIGIVAQNTLVGGNSSASGANGSQGGTAIYCVPTGGGGGGGVTIGNTAGSGGVGGQMGNAALGIINGGTSGTAGGTAGGNGTATRGSGTGGGGGGGNTSGNGGDGGDGGGFGSGGGGGGAAVNDVGNSGKGGDGKPGYVLIITYL
jgi:hypothetical protein